jgi:hypothetical protein
VLAIGLGYGAHANEVLGESATAPYCLSGGEGWPHQVVRLALILLGESPLRFRIMGTTFIDRWFGRALKPDAKLTVTPVIGTDSESQFKEGLHCVKGEGMVPDYALAADWYGKAAGQGHPVAQFTLGMMYGQGLGVVRDETAAGKWLGKAAGQGHAEAQYQVGVRQHHASQRGVPAEASERRIEALKWLELAVAQGVKNAGSAREFVVLGMTWEEAVEGARRATAFVAGAPGSNGTPV